MEEVSIFESKVMSVGPFAAIQIPLTPLATHALLFALRVADANDNGNATRLEPSVRQ